jgi:hypothetical protein
MMQDLNHAKHPLAVDYDESITIKQIQSVVHKVAPEKALGSDGITYRVVTLWVRAPRKLPVCPIRYLPNISWPWLTSNSITWVTQRL